MINQDEVKEIEARYKECCRKFSKMSEDTFNDEQQDFVVSNMDRGRLLVLLDQFLPRPFDPEDRGTWPPFNEELIINYKGGTRDLAVITCCVGKQFQIKSFGMNVGRFLGSIKSWQPLPPVGKEGEG